MFTLNSVVLVPRGGTKRRPKRRKPRRRPVKKVKVEHSPSGQHNAVAEKQEVTATAAEHTGTPPEVPNNAGINGQDKTAGSAGSNPGLFHKVLNHPVWQHPVLHDGVKAGVRAATAALNGYADNKGTGGE